MKYDVLEPFKEYLISTESPNTAKKYYASIKKLFLDMQFNTAADIDKNRIEEKIKELKSKNEISAVKNGLIRLKIFEPNVNIPSEDFFHSEMSGKRNIRKNRKKIMYLDKTKRKINQIKDKKLKLAYRLAIKSGLRVSELANLKPEDVSISDEGEVKVYVKNGKGGKNGIVECMKDEYLSSNLSEYVKSVGPGEKLFYSARQMQKKALELGLEMHDLRRIYAITHRNQLIKEAGNDKISANKIVQKNLRHAKFRTTLRYLKGKKLV